MWMALYAVAGVLGLVSLVCGIIILIGAFKESLAQGLLSLLVPFYILYYAFARFQHPKKGLVVGGWLGAAILAGVLVNGATAWFGPDVAAQEGMGDDFDKSFEDGFEDDLGGGFEDDLGADMPGESPSGEGN
jgi:hypothetical protein